MAEKTIELLSPAGDMERLRMSLAYGADAVYLAGPDFGMRSFAGNFTPEELRQAVELCHSRGVAVHVTCNTMPRNDEAARLPEHLERLNDAGVDALIVADLGAFTLAGRYAPRCQRHISTPASICNYETARAWYDLGASRVILARELGLEGKVDVRLKPRKSPYMQSFALEEDHRLVRTLQAQFRAVTGEDLPCAYDASVCDSNILAVTLGIPTVTFGPSGGNMHGDNEYGYAWQVKNCGEIYRRTVAELLNNEE